MLLVNQRFTKMQAAGNDFMVVLGASPRAPSPQRIRALADRRRGVGFDQLLWVDKPANGVGGTVEYRVFNADGGEAGQCGNGALCIAALVGGDRPGAGELSLKSSGGEVRARFPGGDEVSCSLGCPEWAPQRVPFDAPQPPPYEIAVDGVNWPVDVLSLGNPHAILQVDDAAAADVSGLGARLSAHKRFPRGCNVGFAEKTGDQTLKLRVYERGVGETLACGTGACAAAVAGIRHGRLRSPVEVHMPGGELRVAWAGGGEPVWLTGKIESVFEGRVQL